MAVAFSSAALFYTPSRLAAFFSAWPELEALAETPVSAHGLIGPDRDRPTPATPANARQKGRHADPMYWPCIVADVQQAHAALTSGGLGVQAIAHCMKGWDVEDFADHHGRPYAEVRTLFEQAVDKLARWLEPYATASGA